MILIPIKFFAIEVSTVEIIKQKLAMIKIPSKFCYLMHLLDIYLCMYVHVY